MELIREIIVPTENTYVLHLPDAMIGRQVEVIAFDLGKTVEPPMGNAEKMERLRASLDGLRVDLSGFKFDRDEANDYD